MGPGRLPPPARPLSPLCFVPGAVRLNRLPALLHHRLGKNAVASGRVVGEHMGHCPGQLAVLQNGRAAQECVKLGTTFL